MSDPKSPAGEPVEEPTEADDVVSGAHDSLADAEAAARDAVGDTEPAEPAVDFGHAETEATAEPAFVEPDVERETAPEDAEAHHDLSYIEAAGEAEPEPDAPEAATTAYDTYEPSAEPYVAPSEPVEPVAPVVSAEQSEVIAPAAVATAAAAPQPIFVQAPEAPRPKGNRAAAGAIGLLAAVAFGILYLIVGLVIGLVNGDITGENLVTSITSTLTTWAFWVPVAVFFLAFWLVGAIINRGRWGVWVHVGLLVGFASYGGYILGQLFQAPFWTLTASEGAELVESHLLTPLGVAAFIIGRELTIWFGAWVAARGKRVAELNTEALREYERTLEAGPQLVRQ